MGNDVVIRVTAKNAVKEGFDLSKRDVRNFSEEAADIFTLHFGQKIRRLGKQIEGPLSLAARDMGKQIGQEVNDHLSETLTTTVKTRLVRDSETAGDEIGRSLGRSASHGMEDELETRTQTVLQRIKQRIRTVVSGDKDTDRHGAKSGGLGDGVDEKNLGRFETVGKEIGEKISGGIGGALSNFFSGDLISLLIKVIAGAGIAALLAPVIGGAVITAVGLAFGGGVIGLGIASALKDPVITGAIGDLKKQMKGLFAEFGKPFRSPIADVLENMGRFIKTLGPQMKQISELFAPVVRDLGNGLVALLQNAMPGILSMVKASKPLFDTLAKHMPAIGDALGKFFGQISEQGDDATLFFSDLLTAIEKLIVFMGGLIATFASAYSTVHKFVAGSIKLVNDMRNSFLNAFSAMKRYILQFVLYALDKFGALLAGAADAFSWIPGIGSKLKGAESRFNSFRHKVNAELQAIHDKDVSVRLHVIGLGVAKAAATVMNFLRTRASGGIQGAATGGIRSGMTWVGEQGPELVSLPAGATVHSAGDSQRMMRGAGGGGQGGVQTVRLVADHATERSLIGVLFSLLRAEVATQGGGNVQLALGRAR